VRWSSPPYGHHRFDSGVLYLVEEIDPLDAFMAELQDSTPPERTIGATFAKKTTHQRPEAMFGDDEDVDVTAVGDEKAEDVLALAAIKKKKREMPDIESSSSRKFATSSSVISARLDGSV
jgi:hypothetical protein